jgi:hypothetical protein
MHPVVPRARWTERSITTWGLRRREKAYRNIAPEDVPLRGVEAFDREGNAWVFLDDDMRFFVRVELPRARRRPPATHRATTARGSPAFGRRRTASGLRRSRAV